jgi:hypothetical protein
MKEAPDYQVPVKSESPKEVDKKLKKRYVGKNLGDFGHQVAEISADLPQS